MKLGYKSRVILDLILTSGIDIIEFATFPRKFLSPIGGWSEDRYLNRHIKTMHDKGWIIWDDSKETGKWVLRITNAGRKAIQEDVDPEAYWSRSWDGKWRMIAFDLPASKQTLRRELLLWLRSRRFGRLQDSLWVAPCFDELWHDDLASSKFDPSGVSFIEGCSFAKSSDRDFVAKSWNFDEINRRYKQLIDFHTSTKSGESDSAFGTWIHQENQLWRDAFEMDPFLPEALLPKRYLGKQAFAARKRSYSRLRE